MHTDFVKINSRFLQQYGSSRGAQLYRSWMDDKGYNDTKEFPKVHETKEFQCKVVGLEVKELENCFHVEGLIATTHVDDLTREEGVNIPDKIQKETLDAWRDLMNTSHEARVMGVHHSEGAGANETYMEWVRNVGAEDLRDKRYGTEYFGEADVEANPVKVIELTDGEHGLYVDTKLLKTDPMTPKIIEGFENGHFNSFSITYDTDGFKTTDFGWVNDELVRILLPATRLAGYTASSSPKNPNAVATAYGFKEFKELVGIGKLQLNTKEVKKMTEKKEVKEDATSQDGTQDNPSSDEDKDQTANDGSDQPSNTPEGNSEESESKEFQTWKANKKELEEKEILEKTADKLAEKVIGKMELKEKVLKDNKPNASNEVSLEIKEFREVLEDPGKLELKEQFRRAAAICDASPRLDWRSATTTAVESREYKSFGVNGTNLEFKGLGITTNQNTDSDYLQSSAELQDVYDPVIYNALNQRIVTWNLLAKDDFSSKGNNQIQFTLKIAANASASFYTGNSVATGVVTRLKYQTKFKKLQVGVSVDGDMIAAARGGPVSDVFLHKKYWIQQWTCWLFLIWLCSQRRD